MDFREFATNYLNPVFLFYRAFPLTIYFWLLFLSTPFFTNSASASDLLSILAITLVSFCFVYYFLRRRPYLLYLALPFILIIVAFSIRGPDVVEEGILKLPMAMWWLSSLLVGWNGIRSWGYGTSLNDINEKLNKY